MSSTELNNRIVKSGKGYQINPSPHHERLYVIQLDKQVVSSFFEEVREISSQQLGYIPYMRFVVTDKLVSLLDEDFQKSVRGLLHDRNSGGFTVGVNEQTTDPEDYIKFSTAFSHLVGIPNFDAMSGNYYARFTVNHTDDSDSYLRQAYRLFTLHTDGTYVDETTDWLLMMKFDEQNATGGRSRLLHLDDWDDLNGFYHHPMASQRLVYKAPPSKNVVKEVFRTTFYELNNAPCICFIDQFVHPENIEQATYLKDLSSSMENASATTGLELPSGELIMLNNRFWLHGREAFEENTGLHRELLRQRGRFA